MSVIRSGRFAEAASLAEIHGLDGEIVCQNQWLALMYQENVSLCANTQEFIRLVHVTLAGIKHRPNWVLSECLHRIPRCTNSWKPIDLFQAVKAILDFGLTKCGCEYKALFKARLRHVDVLTAAFAEECAIASASISPISRTTQDWANDLQILRRFSVIDLCLFYLHSRRYHAFSVLLKHYHVEVLPNVLALISTISPTESPSDYLDLALSPLLPYASQVETKANDDDPAVARLYSYLPKKYADFRNLNPMTIATWACMRVFELDEQTGFISGAIELVDGILQILSTNQLFSLPRSRKAIRKLTRMRRELDQFSVVSWISVNV